MPFAWAGFSAFNTIADNSGKEFVFFLGCTWFSRFRFMNREKEKDKKKKKPKKTKKNLLMQLVIMKRKILCGLLISVKTLCRDLQHLSKRRLEINLCTPDFMANAFSL